MGKYLEPKVLEQTGHALGRAFETPDSFDFAAASQSYREEDRPVHALKSSSSAPALSKTRTLGRERSAEIVNQLRPAFGEDEKIDALCCLPMVDLASASVPPWEVADRVVNLVS